MTTSHGNIRCMAVMAFFHAWLAISVPASAQAPGTDVAQSPRTLATTLTTPAEGMIVSPVETLSVFRPLVPGHPDGPNILVLEGDPYEGPSITLFRYSNNYEGSRRLHTHTHTYRSILIEGEMKHWDADGIEATAPVLRPGSYWRQPGGELHADHCLSQRCLALVTFEGQIDADFREGPLRTNKTRDKTPPVN